MIIRWIGIRDVCEYGDFIVEITVEMAEVGKRDATRKGASLEEEKKEKEEDRKEERMGKGH